MDQYGISGLVLMENAGRGAAEVIHRISPGSRVVILCGKGNNAGDGYVIARHLQLLDHDVVLVSIVDLAELAGDAAANAAIAVKANIDLRIAGTEQELRAAAEGAEIILDCLLGTGAQGALKEPFSTAVSVANGMPATRIAIDLPTGLDCDSGAAGAPTFRADHTITFVAEKLGLSQKNADEYVGVVHVVGIGVPKELLEKFA
jgi:NAD(P)H-hydrate epimerase